MLEIVRLSGYGGFLLKAKMDRVNVENGRRERYDNMDLCHRCYTCSESIDFIGRKNGNELDRNSESFGENLLLCPSGFFLEILKYWDY
jgi:hypothetical protein